MLYALRFGADDYAFDAPIIAAPSRRRERACVAVGCLPPADAAPLFAADALRRLRCYVTLSLLLRAITLLLRLLIRQLSARHAATLMHIRCAMLIALPRHRVYAMI